MEAEQLQRIDEYFAPFEQWLGNDEDDDDDDG
ncbi:hypothetical protein MCOR24_010927 [Pyricularia oryzae]|nr:hypothetical protein MCOR24_010927 [Pyricularia oryzae]KAI6530831.1 hypothetical protein MCOR16_004500 [Pyricularia oryzae]